MRKTKNILVAGSSGFIGTHLVRHLKQQGHYVIGTDIVEPKFEHPHKFYFIDLRSQRLAFEPFHREKEIDEIYNLACLMGGMGFIGDDQHSYNIMAGSSMIIANVLECCRHMNVKKIFYSSSACVYNMHKQEQPDVSLKERDAYPAMPDLVYGWQKLFGEQMHQAAAQSEGLDIRIARFHNIFGPECIFAGGKEKAPAAICRKVALARNGEAIEVWGDGQQTRSFLYVQECIDGIQRLMDSPWQHPVNIGSSEDVTVNELADMIIKISGKKLTIKNVPGHAGVRGRNSDNTMCQELLGWAPEERLIDGLRKTYSWIEERIGK